MTPPPTNIFIGSSQSARKFVTHLDACLNECAGEHGVPVQVNPWMNVFRNENSQAFIETVDRQLHSNDYFIMILTPDAEVRNESGGSLMRVGSDNVILEAGAVIGRHGIDRLFFIWDRKAHAPSDLGLEGRKAFLFDSTADPAVWQVRLQKLAGDIVGTIQKKAAECRVNDGRTRYLSLIKCAPGRQRRVVRTIDQFEDEARKNWLVRYEHRGVVWGPPDNYILFSAPGQRYFEQFIEELRKRFQANIRQLDTRTVFTKRYWRTPPDEPGAGGAVHLVMLSCAPSHVESAYGLIVQAAEGKHVARKYKVRITNVGVMMGSDDVFLITESPSVAHHHTFIEKFLQPRLTENDWLVENTTSLMTTA